jgi:hypothetical protein
MKMGSPLPCENIDVLFSHTSTVRADKKSNTNLSGLFIVVDVSPICHAVGTILSTAAMGHKPSF